MTKRCYTENIMNKIFDFLMIIRWKTVRVASIEEERVQTFAEMIVTFMLCLQIALNFVTFYEKKGNSEK